MKIKCPRESVAKFSPLTNCTAQQWDGQCDSNSVTLRVLRPRMQKHFGTHKSCVICGDIWLIVSKKTHAGAHKSYNILLVYLFFNSVKHLYPSVSYFFFFFLWHYIILICSVFNATKTTQSPNKKFWYPIVCTPLNNVRSEIMKPVYMRLSKGFSMYPVFSHTVKIWYVRLLLELLSNSDTQVHRLIIAWLSLQ
jgi:hypothetical protein